MTQPDTKEQGQTRRKPKPWQRHTPRTQRPPVYALDQPAETIVHIYRGGAIFVTIAENNGRVRQHPVSPTALTAALANLPQTSGLLPKNTLATGQIGGEPFIVVYVPPRTAKISCQPTAGGGVQRYTIQTPPLVCGLCGHDFRIFALNSASFPAHDGVRLYNAPWPNTYSNGSVCWGTTKLPKLPTIHAFVMLYLEGSAFSPHLTRDRSRKYQDIAKLYSQLNIKKPYPLDDLIFSGQTLDWLISGAAWSARWIPGLARRTNRMHTTLDELAAAFGPAQHFHITTPDDTLPPPHLGTTYIWAANGIFKQGANADMLARICVEPFARPIVGLAVLDTVVQWRAWPDERLPGALLQQALEEARKASIPGDNITYPIEAQFFIVARERRALLIKPPQIGSSMRVYASVPQGPILADIHSHARIHAFFSETDDHDDQGLSVSAVIGNIFIAPEIACRINVYGDSLVVPAGAIFDRVEPFVDSVYAHGARGEETATP